MADINTGDGGGQKGKPKKETIRVDFTPMVDMNMLLITFFMFVTTLSKPQMMDLAMPAKDRGDDTIERPKTADDRTTTILLDGNDVVYYYFGQPNFEDYTSLHKTDYSPEGLRAVLTEKNGPAVARMAELRLKKQRKEITEEEFREESKKIRSEKNGQVVIIKPMDNSTYKNLVDVLDEMQITSIGTYAIVDVTEGDEFLIENLQQEGALTQQAAEVQRLESQSRGRRR